MARPPPTALRGIAAFSGMLCFITAASIYPQVSIIRDEDSTSIRYQRSKQHTSQPPPSDPGLVLSPAPKRIIPNTNNNNTSPRQQSGFRENDWIFDTGATTHVCTNRALLHSYSSFAHTRHAAAVGHFGPNAVPIAGIGDCTLDLPGPSTFPQASNSFPHSTNQLAIAATDTLYPNQNPKTSLLSNPLVNQILNPKPSDRQHTTTQSANSSESIALAASPRFQSGGDKRIPHGRLTLRNVTHIPTAGLNIISWSQLKRAKGLDLHLVEHEDGSLAVLNRRRAHSFLLSDDPRTGEGGGDEAGKGGYEQIMRFVLRDGLYFLDRGDLIDNT